MTDTIDIPTLKTKVNIIDVIGRYISLKKRGSEHEAMCCFHNDKNPSLKVNERKQLWACYPCGKGGDVLDFLLAKGRTMDEAVKELQQVAGEIPFTKSKSSDDWTQIPAIDDIAFKIKHYKYDEPSTVWRYANERNQCIGYVCRFDLPDGKETIPFTWCTHINTGKSSWRWHGFASPRALYNLYELTQRPDAIVLLVEGEKTCDAAKVLFPSLVCVTWQGGSKALRQSNWSALNGRKVIGWGDNDTKQAYPDGTIKPWHEQPGNKAMIDIASILNGKCSSFRMVENPHFAPHAWDLADPLPLSEGSRMWTPAEAQDYLKKNLYWVRDLINKHA